LKTLKKDTVLLERIETEYNQIFVYSYKSYVKMKFRRYGRGKEYSESVINRNNPFELCNFYYKLISSLGIVYARNPKDLLMIGLGGGVFTGYLKRHMLDEINITCVEIDPGVIAAAKKYFSVTDSPNYKLIAEDGRVFLSRNTSRFDIIIVDAYLGGFVPFHLTTQEFYQLIKKRLNPGGCAVFNFKPWSKLYDSNIVTLRSIFKDVVSFDDGRITVAYTTPISDEELKERAQVLQKRFNFYYDLQEIIKTPKYNIFDATAKILTDDFAPANFLNAIKRYNARSK